MKRMLVLACWVTSVALLHGQVRPPQKQLPPPIAPGFDGPFPEIPNGRNFRPGDTSHNPRPGEEDVPDVRDFLSGIKLPKQSDIDQAKLQDLLKKLPKDKQNLKQIEDMLKNNPQFKDPEFLKHLQKLVDSPDFAKNLQNQLGQDSPIPKKLDDPGVIKNQLDEVLNKAKDPLNGIDPKTNMPNPDRPPSLTDPNNPANDEWLKWFEKQLGESQASKDLMKEMASALGNSDMKGLFDQFPELKGQDWKDFGDWGKENFGKMKPSDLPDFKMGGSNNNSGGGGNLFGSGGGGGGSPLGSSGGSGGSFDLGEGAGTVIAIIAGLAGVALLAFFFARKWKLDQAQKAASAAGLAGLDLSSIRTREELVAAFDAVTLDQIGDEARNWNHRVIAGEFVEQQPANTDPANELASLYEKARYAPLDEDLTPHEFADAQRDLHVLAGVSA